MKKILLSALMLSTLAFVSCNDSDDNSGVQDTRIYLPTKIESTEYIQTFVYDSENRLIESKEIDDDGSYTNQVTFEYVNDKLVSAKEITTEVGDAQTYVSTEDYTFSYQDNRVTITEVYTSNWGSSTNTAVITINANGKLISGDDLIATYDANGNLTELVEEDVVKTFEYDAKNGVLKNVKTPQWVLHVVLQDLYQFKFNNAVKLVDVDSDEEDQEITNISYQYNSANYPIKMNVSDSENFLDSITVEYLKR